MEPLIPGTLTDADLDADKRLDDELADLDADKRLDDELNAGWRVAFERDPADPRFVTFTSRHPYPLAEELPPAATGLEAQIHTLAFAVTTCSQQGIIPGQVAMQILRSLGRQIAEIKAGNVGNLIIVPGQ